MGRIGKDPEDMTDDELLEYIASPDPEKYPLVPVAKRALEDDGARGDAGPTR